MSAGRLLLCLSGILTLAGRSVAVEPDVVEMRTTDGLTIQGDLFSTGLAGGAGVVALHMYPADRTSWRPVAPLFAAAGMHFLAIDMRGYGGSRMQDSTDLGDRVRLRDPELFQAMHRDALAARELLIARGVHPARVGFVGASVGCSVAIQAASMASRVRCVAVMSPGTNYLGVPTLEHLGGYRGRPLLILAPEEEAARDAIPIRDAHGEEAELRIFDQPKIHGTYMFGKVAGIEQRLVTWFRDALGAPVALDGTLSEAEAEGGPLATFPHGSGKLVCCVRQHGRNIHAAVVARGCEFTGDFFLCFAPGGEPTRGVGLLFHGAQGTHQRRLFRDGRWVPVRVKRLPGAVDALVARGEATEALIPLGSRHYGIETGAEVRVGFALVDRGDALLSLIEGDPDLDEPARWPEIDLE